MTLLTKGIIFILFLALLAGLIALLPDAQCAPLQTTGCYPLPPQVATSITIILGYVFAWAGVFWFLNIWFALALITIGFELIVWVAKKIIWIIGWVSRLVA